MCAADDRTVVELREVSKRFPGVLAVDRVDVAIKAGDVHVVAGENGAGKSTLMKLLSQVVRPDEGTMLVAGAPVPFHGPRYAQSLGIAMVYQEFALAPHLSVAENLSLGREPTRVGLRIDPNRVAGTLSVAEQQLVEIAKALAIDAKLVILDEPTATLTEHEIDELFEVIDALTGRGTRCSTSRTGWTRSS